MEIVNNLNSALSEMVKKWQGKIDTLDLATIESINELKSIDTELAEIFRLHLEIKQSNIDENTELSQSLLLEIQTTINNLTSSTSLTLEQLENNSNSKLDEIVAKLSEISITFEDLESFKGANGQDGINGQDGANGQDSVGGVGGGVDSFSFFKYIVDYIDFPELQTSVTDDSFTVAGDDTVFLDYDFYTMNYYLGRHCNGSNLFSYTKNDKGLVLLKKNNYKRITPFTDGDCENVLFSCLFDYIGVCKNNNGDQYLYDKDNPPEYAYSPMIHFEADLLEEKYFIKEDGKFPFIDDLFKKHKLYLDDRLVLDYVVQYCEYNKMASLILRLYIDSNTDIFNRDLSIKSGFDISMIDFFSNSVIDDYEVYQGLDLVNYTLDEHIARLNP